jgi:hypothetical protein
VTKVEASENAREIEHLTKALKNIIATAKAISDEDAEQSLDTIGAAIELRLHVLLDTAQLASPIG